MKGFDWKKAVFLLLPFIVILSLVNANPKSALEEDQGDKTWTNHEKLGTELTRIEEESNGKIDVEILTYSPQGREIYSVRAGEGDRVLFMTSEIHGNEKNGTEVILSLFETLGTSDHPEVLEILERLTIVAVPKVNADGSENVTRQNEITWEEIVENHPQLAEVEPAWYHTSGSIPGLNINREFNPDLDYVPNPDDFPGTQSDFGYYLSSEAQGVAKLYKELETEFGIVDGFVDLHGMPETPVIEDGPVHISLTYPPFYGRDGFPKYAEFEKLDQDKSRRFTMAAVKGMREYAEDGKEPVLAQYNYIVPETNDFPSMANNAFGLRGSGSVLFEIAGHQPEVPYNPELIQHAVNGLWGIAKAMADRSIEDIDGDEFFDLPKYTPESPPVSEPDQYSTDFTGEQSLDEWSPIWGAAQDQFTILDAPTRLQYTAKSGIQGLTSDKIGEIYGNADIFGLVRGSESQETLFEIGISMSGNPNNENGIYADAQLPDENFENGSIRLMKRTNGRIQTIGQKELPFKVKENKWYRVLLQRDSQALRLKMWPDGEEEPRLWQLVRTDRTMWGGKVGISHSHPDAVNDYAFIGIGVSGMEAPQAPDNILDPDLPENTGDLIDLVERLNKEEELGSEKDVRLLTTHLTAISHYESQGQTEKMVRHMKSFKNILNYQLDNELITEKAFDWLNTQANHLIDMWE